MSSNAIQEEVDSYLVDFIREHGFKLAMESSQNNVHVAAYRNKQVSIAFGWAPGDGKTVHVASPSATPSAPEILNSEGGWRFISDYWADFYRRYLEAMRVLDYPDTPSVGEYYGFMDKSLREFMAMIVAGRVVLTACKEERSQ